MNKLPTRPPLRNRLCIHIFNVRVGDYLSFGGHLVQDYLCDEWWKVTDMNGERLRLVNKQGKTAGVNCHRHSGIKVFRWTPGIED